MALENAARKLYSTWFLLAHSGNLLRLRGILHIGEDETGDLILTPDPAEALLTITPDDRTLQLECAQNGWMLSDDTANNTQGCQSLTLMPGDTVELTLPNDRFMLTGNTAQHSPITRRVILMVEPEIPTLNVRVEPEFVAMAIESPGPSPADSPEADPEPNAFLEPILIQEAKDRPLREEVTETVTKGDQPQIRPTTADTSKRPPQPNRTILTLMIAGLVFALYFTAHSQQPNAIAAAAQPAGKSAFPAEKTLQLLGSSASTVIEEPQPSASDAPTTSAPPREPANTIPADIASTVSVRSSTPTLPAIPAPELDSEPQQSLELQLAEAQRLMAQGTFVNAANDNAVEILSAVLNADPTNERGLELIYECAMRLLDQARAANAAGDEFLARNLTEEVLAFHPTLPEALALRSQLWAR
jgi:hypothetical protein